MKKSSIPKRVLKKIRKMPDSGVEAIDNYYDENSDFFVHAMPSVIIPKLSSEIDGTDDLYHYTTTDSLKKIINKKVWLVKQIKFMNDPDEFKYTIRLGVNILMELGASSKEINEFKRTLLKSPFNNSYIWSFTQNRYSQTLFGNYGGNKKGVALKFKVDDILLIIENQFSLHNSNLNDYLSGGPYAFPLMVIYDEKKQYEYLKPVVREWLLAYRNIKIDPYDMNSIIMSCLPAINIFAICFKNPLLRQEEEIRFVIANIDEKKLGLLIDEISFVKFEINCDSIKEIIIQTGNDVNLEVLKKNMIEEGFNKVKVSYSKLPY